MNTISDHSGFSPWQYSASPMLNESFPYSLLRKSTSFVNSNGREHVERLSPNILLPGDAWPYAIVLLVSMLGLRIGDIRGLKIEHIDWRKAVIHVTQQKTKNSQELPMSEEIGTPVFPSVKGALCNSGIFTISFRKVLSQAGIQPGGKCKGPRLHDLRHTFAVHNLEKWLKSKEDIQAKLPILANYLGHASILGTQRYLRLTPSLFPEITLRMENSIGKLISFC